MSSFTKHCSSRVSLEKRIARRFLCCPPSPICFLTLFFHMTVQTALDSKLDDEMNVDPNVLVICEEVALAHTIGLLSATDNVGKSGTKRKLWRSSSGERGSGRKGFKGSHRGQQDVIKIL